MGKHDRKIAIAGAGLVGSLLAIYLARRGYEVHIFERRSDMRRGNAEGGRSINLALSNRGLRALEKVGLATAVKEATIPMHGRMMHDLRGQLSFLPYGKAGQYINSVSRSGLNMILMDEAEKAGAIFHFSQRCKGVNSEHTTILFDDKPAEKFDVILGADGAFSAVRGSLQVTDRYNYQQHYIEHGYKELLIPPGPDDSFLLEKNALHIWPRESFMMIALPNPDGSFTCTLFFPFEGSPSFSGLKTADDVTLFFLDTFPDAVPLMPTLTDDYFNNPTSSLVTIRCYPWVRNHTALIGDAAHGVVPFYGQGMNAGFEDCRILDELLDLHHDNWTEALAEYQSQRKPDAEAIADLALENFVEMRDLVADADFLLRKKIEAQLHEKYPDRWIPQYGMVTFQDTIRYSEAQRLGRKQREIMDEVMKYPDIHTSWTSLDLEAIVAKL